MRRLIKEVCAIVSKLLPCERTVATLEKIVRHTFETEPFHTFKLLYGDQFSAPILGGTCSDKTASFIQYAKQAGFDIHWHTALIGGQPIHRLARIYLSGKTYFADVGNGWPALRLYPADQPIVFHYFGMTFRTEIATDRLLVFHTRLNKESLQLEILFDIPPESVIEKAIRERFSTGIKYPFMGKIRFSQIVQDRFLFLRNNQLEIYSDHAFEQISDILPCDLENILKRYFHLNIQRPNTNFLYNFLY